MKVATILFAFMLLTFGFFIPSIPAKNYGKGTDGGFRCIGCTYIVSMLDQLSFVYNESTSQAAQRFCSFLPNDQLAKFCKNEIEKIVPWLDNMHFLGATPDLICQTLHICTNKKGKFCYLFPQKSTPDELQKYIEMRKHFPFVDELAKTMVLLDTLEPELNSFEFLCKLPLLKQICLALKNYHKHLPVYDKDGDLFSQTYTFRGAYWRGKDCNDSNAKIHPGTKVIDSDVNVDSNCNGIYGTDSQGRPYEDLFCKNTSQRGFAVVGDSVAAHLHLPEEWFDAKKLSKDALKDVVLAFENEFDWPQLSAMTGFMNSIWKTIKVKTDSLYFRLWERNHCIHRDYQNIGINGASSFTQTKFVKSLSRNQTSDHPLIVIYSLLGNDVCNWYPNTLEHMTTPEEIFQNTMKVLKYLDTILPNGSFVIISGLVDGRLLYNSLHDRIHPIGRSRNDVTYKDYFDYFDCLQVSMCAGWLTSNKTRRNLTQQRANQLSDVLEKIVKNHNHFKNFRLHFIKRLFSRVMDYWRKKGGSDWQIIEPVDGFHDNQIGQEISAKIIWNDIEKHFPEALGPVNPNNKNIKQIFGDQNGY